MARSRLGVRFDLVSVRETEGRRLSRTPYAKPFPIFSSGVHMASLTHGGRGLASLGEVGGCGRKASPNWLRLCLLTIERYHGFRFDLSVLPLTGTGMPQCSCGEVRPPRQAWPALGTRSAEMRSTGGRVVRKIEARNTWRCIRASGVLQSVLEKRMTKSYKTCRPCAFAHHGVIVI